MRRLFGQICPDGSKPPQYTPSCVKRQGIGNDDQYVDNNGNEENDEFEDEQLVQKEGMEEEKEEKEGGRIDERDNNLQENKESGEAMNYKQYMKALCSDISGDVTSLYKQKPCRDMSNLLSYNISSWLNERPAELIKHLKALCNLDHSAKSDFLITKMIEHIYDCRNKRLVLPLAFRENLVTYKMSNSPLLTSLNGNSSPSGAHTFLTTWLNNNASQCLEFPEGLVRVVFDNEQVIGKRYRVKANQQSVPTSVITSHAYLSIDVTNNIQYNNTYSPSH